MLPPSRQICCRFSHRVTWFLDLTRKNSNSAVISVMHGAGSPQVGQAFGSQAEEFGLLLLCPYNLSLLCSGPVCVSFSPASARACPEVSHKDHLFLLLSPTG